MKCQISRDELLRALQRLQGVVERKSTMPILAHILLEATRDEIVLFATDLEIAIRSHLPAEIETPGGISVSAKKLYEIIRELSDTPVLLEAPDAHHLQIRAGSASFSLVGLPKEDFPSLPSTADEWMLTLSRAVLADMVRKTLFSVAENDPRQVLNGVLVHAFPVADTTDVSLFLVGTDGHRLAESSRACESGGHPLNGERKIVVPRKAMAEIRKILDDGPEEVTLGFSRNHLSFRQDGTTLTARLIEGAYPHYQQVIPASTSVSIDCDRVLLQAAMRRVSILAREKTNAVRISLGPAGVTLSTDNPDLGEATESLPIPPPSQEVTIGFNARYILDILAAIDQDTVRLSFIDALSPCLITPSGASGYQCVVMPMRV
ncbi:MAG: DNA polymerase III subunit beta [Nitrospirae bacterium]|nr:DNA polymerase III subunit beta [Nitrospirota bacterium]MBI3393851.1 DNA polymerase III subunit beta [Nitrospirota bacterium]